MYICIYLGDYWVAVKAFKLRYYDRETYYFAYTHIMTNYLEFRNSNPDYGIIVYQSDEAAQAARFRTSTPEKPLGLGSRVLGSGFRV